MRYQPWVESKRGAPLLPAQKLMVLDKGEMKSSALAEMKFTAQKIAEVSKDFDEGRARESAQR